MRIPSGVTDQYIGFVAVDATDYVTRETGLASFTVVRSRNGAADATYTTPTVVEADATTMPGCYWLLLDEDMTIGSGNDSEEVMLHITHAGMAPATVKFELYREKITQGNTLNVNASGGAEVGSFQTGAITSAAFAADAITAASIAANAIGSAELADGAITAAKIATGAIDADALATDAVTEIQSGLALAADLATAISYIDTEVGAIKAKTDNLPTDPADQSALEALINAISAPTANENADALLDRVDGVETGYTVREVLRIVSAVLGGKASGMGTTTAIFRDLNDTTNRVQATVDGDGNRSTVVLDVS